MSEPTLEVIVLDDRSRFALHVWRYLSRSVGFGIGKIPHSGESSAAKWPLETPANDALVTWVDISSRTTPKDAWKRELQKAVDSPRRAARRIFLVDVRGDGSQGDGEFWNLACQELEQCGVTLSAEEIWLVSSYGVGTREYPEDDREDLEDDRRIVKWNIRPKSVETLQELAEIIWPPQRPLEQPSKSELHFLVTGAGFELKGQSWPEINPLGVPSTGELLSTAYAHRLWPSMGDYQVPGVNKDSYPLPPMNRKDTTGGPAAFHASSLRDLDKLWNSLLQSILGYDAQGEREKTAEKKAEMLNAERRARESFRSAFLAYDWGPLSQALDAASLPWDAWLTTNYTQFMDRAVALLAAARKSREQELPTWRILSIAAEAELLIRQLFFEGRQGKARQEERFIFKLHGDLANLSTMAIAGHDKELFSPLTHSVGSLHWMYEAAGRWIECLIQSRSESSTDGEMCKVYWHIVGHGLRDEVLVQTIQGIVDATRSQAEHSFLFVQPNAAEVIETLLSEPTKEWCHNLKPRLCGADVWLAKLAKFYRGEGHMWNPSFPFKGLSDPDDPGAGLAR